MLETVVAVSVIALALTMTLALLAQEPTVDRRLRAHDEALRALDWSLETLRAGASPTGLADGPLPLDGFYAAEARPSAEGLMVIADVEQASFRGLFRLQLSARYQVRGQPYVRTVETYLWRPIR